MKPVGFSPSATCPPELISAMARLRGAATRIADANSQLAVQAELAKMKLKPLVFSDGIIA